MKHLKSFNESWAAHHIISSNNRRSGGFGSSSIDTEEEDRKEKEFEQRRFNKERYDNAMAFFKGSKDISELDDDNKRILYTVYEFFNKVDPAIYPEADKEIKRIVAETSATKINQIFQDCIKKYSREFSEHIKDVEWIREYYKAIEDSSRERSLPFDSARDMIKHFEMASSMAIQSVLADRMPLNSQSMLLDYSNRIKQIIVPIKLDSLKAAQPVPTIGSRIKSFLGFGKK